MCGPTSSSGKICRNCTVCGKICVDGAECTNCTDCDIECVSSTNPKTRVTKSRTMFKIKHVEGCKFKLEKERGSFLVRDEITSTKHFLSDNL